MLSPPPTKPVLAYVVTEDWYFLSHRLPMARAARDAGFDVHVITRVDKGGAAIEAEGFHVHPMIWRRGSLHPLGFVSNILTLRRIYRKISPALLHNVALQPSIVGSLAAQGLDCVRLNALAGLGYIFTSETAKARLARPLLRALLGYVVRHPRAAVLVQNPDDRAAVQRLNVAPDKVHVIPGSGVDTDRLKAMPESDGPVTVGFVGRLLDDKGIRTLVQAQSLLWQRGVQLRLLIAGDPDPANPVSIPPQEIANWARQPGIEVLGHVGDVRDVWKRAHIAVLPSRREGLPLSLLEAAACGRPMVATDVPGCREIARPDVNALLVPPDDAARLADALARLAQDVDLRARFGAAGRRMIEETFSAARIGTAAVALYNRLLAR